MNTIDDVARRAGVSAVTVSRVLNGGRYVHVTTREKVIQAIEELHYVPNSAARSLRSKRTHTLALLVTDITNPFWTTIARGVEDEAQKEEYSVLFCNTDEDPAKLLRYLNVIISQRVDGAIIAPYHIDARNLSKLRDRKIPTVIVDRRIKGWDVDSVSGDSISGARAAVKHLIGLGHRRIAVISGPKFTSTAEDRVDGYIMALDEAGIPIDPGLIKRGDFRSTVAEELTHQVLDEGHNPTAIFATNNMIAMGVLKAVEKRGIRIPQDIALVCFDDFPDLAQVFPFLTVVAQPAYEMGANAARLLISRLNGEADVQPRHIVLQPRLTIRYSCGSKKHDLSFPVIDTSQIDESTSIERLKSEDYQGLVKEAVEWYPDAI